MNNGIANQFEDFAKHESLEHANETICTIYGSLETLLSIGNESERQAAALLIGSLDNAIGKLNGNNTIHAK